MEMIAVQGLKNLYRDVFHFCRQATFVAMYVIVHMHVYVQVPMRVRMGTSEL